MVILQLYIDRFFIELLYPVIMLSFKLYSLCYIFVGVVELNVLCRRNGHYYLYKYN